MDCACLLFVDNILRKFAFNFSSIAVGYLRRTDNLAFHNDAQYQSNCGHDN